jgi:hypothetical protein
VPKYKLLLLLSVIVSVGLSSNGHVHADAVAPTKNLGITVSPAFTTVQIGSKQPQMSFSVSIRNDFSVPVSMNATVSGLSIHSNTLIPDNRPDSALANLISIVPSSFSVRPGSSLNIIVTVKDTATLSPGGHYVSLRITEVGAAVGSQSRQLSLQPAINSTMYVVKEDGAVRAISATHLHLARSLFSLPKLAIVTFNNSGNVLVVPRGVVTVAKTSNATQVYGQAVINDASVPLFPSQSTTLETNIHFVRCLPLPVKYTVALQYRYDGEDTPQTQFITAWYVPKLYIGLAIVVLGSLYLLVRPTHARRLRKFLRSH